VLAQQELREPVLGPGAVINEVGAGTTRVTDLLYRGRHVDGEKLPGLMQPRQPDAVALDRS
jgi:hypothetical protein